MKDSFVNLIFKAEQIRNFNQLIDKKIKMRFSLSELISKSWNL